MEEKNMKKTLPRWAYILIALIWGYIEWEILRGNSDPEFRTPIQWIWAVSAILFFALCVFNEIEIKKKSK